MRLDPFLLAQTAAEASEPVSSDVLREGTSIAIAGLLIVFSALILISLFIASLPRILVAVGHIWPEVRDGHREEGHTDSMVADDPAVLAAIGFVLHTEFQKQVAAGSSGSGKS